MADSDGWLDETTRPSVTDPAMPRSGHPNQSLLTQVHAHLRDELSRIVEALDQLATADQPPTDADIGDVRAFLHRLAGRQDRYSIGAFCAAYCRTVATHHAIEDQRMFPDLAGADPALQPVLDRLGSEHEVIHLVLERLDRALVTMVSGTAGPAGDDARAAAARLVEVLVSHLAYEEEQLLGPLGRLPVVV